MGKVKILSEEVANRIAAGEVIERPVSIVKELVENAIDAKADKIIVTIENGGKKLIQVIDNGLGMSEDDALQAFERHATSKIRTIDDIFNISTLGFRGEALSSIASISRLILTTRDAGSELASRVEFISGKLMDFTKTSAKIGTSIIVTKLFTNVPARKKFLKSDQVELRHILNYVHYQSILHPDIHFIFRSNNVEKLNYPIVESVEKRLIAVFGKPFINKDLIIIDEQQQDAHLTGYISGLEIEETDLIEFRYIFLNGRFIKDKIILHSIRSAYEPFLKKIRFFKSGKIPPFILFLQMDPGKVDFNVHPAKLEVRFRDSGWVYNFVKNTITKMLLDYEDEKFRNIKERMHTGTQTAKITDIDKKLFTTRSERKRFSEIKKEMTQLYQPDLFKQNIELDRSLQEKISGQKSALFVRPEEEFINPWQLHQSYIFVQVDDGLLIIDQHAAHERIIYEKILHRIHGAPAQTQKLLFPLVLDLPPYLGEIISQLITEKMELFHKIGFSIKSFSNNSVVIDAIPAELQDWKGGDVFIEILKTLEEEFSETEDFRDSISKSVACKTAIKAGKKMSKKEMLSLINDLFACEIPYYCPHGRPLIIKMPLVEFEKKFKRIE